MGSSTIIQTAVRTRKQQNSDLGDSTSDFNNLNFNCVKIQKDVSTIFFLLSYFIDNFFFKFILLFVVYGEKLKKIRMTQNNK